MHTSRHKPIETPDGIRVVLHRVKRIHIADEELVKREQCDKAGSVRVGSVRGKCEGGDGECEGGECEYETGVGSVRVNCKDRDGK